MKLLILILVMLCLAGCYYNDPYYGNPYPALKMQHTLEGIERNIFFNTMANDPGMASPPVSPPFQSYR